MLSNTDNAGLCFDGRWVGDHGIGRFAREIESRIPVLTNASLAGKPSDAFDCFRIWFWLIKNPKKIFFSPGYNAPAFLQRRCIITVHDLNHVDASAGSNLLKRLYYSLVLKRACRHAIAVFTVSEFSRKRILEWSGAAPDRVLNVGNGVSSHFVPQSTETRTCDKKYFLSVSNRKPHKNEERLFSAFAAAALPDEVKLFVSGFATPSQNSWLQQHCLNYRIIFLGQISDAELAKYYRKAIGLVIVSLYEGFGLPAVEAMSCGTPVIASNITSLPEIVGAAALQVNPFSTSDIRRALETLYTNEELRCRLRDLGLRQSQSYSWESVVERVKSRLVIESE